jgi:hypothetical protein
LGAALELTDQILSAAAGATPPLQLRFKELGFEDPADAFARLGLDCAFLRAPVDFTTFNHLHLYDEPLVVAMSRRNALASSAFLEVSDLLNNRIAVAESNNTKWFDYWSLADKLPDAEIVRVASQSEELQLVAAGEACSITIAGAARFAPHPAVSYVPLRGVDPCPTYLIWRKERVTAALNDFINLAVTVRDREPAILASIQTPFGRH